MEKEVEESGSVLKGVLRARPGWAVAVDGGTPAQVVAVIVDAGTPVEVVIVEALSTSSIQ